MENLQTAHSDIKLNVTHYTALQKLMQFCLQKDNNLT